MLSPPPLELLVTVDEGMVAEEYVPLLPVVKVIELEVRTLPAGS